MAADKIKEELIKLRKKELQDKVDAERAAHDAQARDKLLNKRTITNEQGQKTTLWEESERLADRALHDSVQAYNDWRSAMMELIKMFTALNKAIAQSGSEATATVMGMATQLGREFYDNKIAPKFTELDLPDLQHAVSYTDDNKIKFESLGRSDGIATHMDDALNKKYREGINLWLAERGYKPDDSDPGAYVSTQGPAKLTATQFNLMKDNVDHGLDRFLAGETDVKFTPRP